MESTFVLSRASTCPSGSWVFLAGGVQAVPLTMSHGSEAGLFQYGAVIEDPPCDLVGTLLE